MKSNVLEIRPPTDGWAAVEGFLENRYARSTRWMYGASIRKFEVWCRGRGLAPRPASSETVARFLADEAEAGIRPPTITRHVAAIRQAHLEAGFPDPAADPLIPALLRGIRRTVGTRATRKAPVTVDLLGGLVTSTDDTIKGARDRAILLLGFAGAFRRGELAALRVEDLRFREGGLTVLVRRSKGDPDGGGQEVHVAPGRALCPLQSLRVWLAAAGIDRGPVFRRVLKNGRVLDQGLTGHAIGQIVKDAAAKAGLDPAAIGAHSLRSGFLTAAAAKGASEFELRAVSRHRRLESLRPYVRMAAGPGTAPALL